MFHDPPQVILRCLKRVSHIYSMDPDKAVSRAQVCSILWAKGGAVLLSYLQSRALSSSVPPSRSSALNSLEKILLWTKSFQSDTCLRTFKSCLGRMQNKNTVTGSTHWACPTAQQAPNVPGTESLQRGPISQYRVSI